MNSPPATYVLVVSLGPVQEFIATARRCRDLWFGSWLLSELSKAAAESIATSAGAQMIFPPPDTTLDKADWWQGEAVANKVMAVVSGDVEAIADAARMAADLRLDEIASGVWGRLNSDENRELAQEQVAELLEWNWAAAAYQPSGANNDGTDDAFVEARRRAERMLAARKACRDFNAVGSWGSARPKSSLDGARESVIPASTYAQLNATQLYRRYGVRPGEQLCGIGFLKRHGERDALESRIFSTSHVAAQGLLARWNRQFAEPQQRQTARRNVAGFARELHRRGLGADALGTVPFEYQDPIFSRLDAHLLFPNRLAEFFVPPRTKDRDRDRNARSSARTQSESATAVLQKLLREMGGGAPSPYYAVVLADGDFMGAAISAADNCERNQFLSQRLSGFATHAGTIVAAHRGSLIYAGGDDVLALLPLHTALEATRELKEAFDAAFAAPEFDAWLARRPTLSAGIAIVHHLEPLSEALAQARRAEKAAKAVEGKNALAVLLDKRSGGVQMVADKWSGNDESDGLDGRLSAFARWLRAGVVSRALLSDWAELARRYAPPPGRDWTPAQWDAVSEEWALEAVWLARRKRERGGNARLQQAMLDDLAMLVGAARTRDARGPWLAALVSEVSLAREIAVARHIAAADDFVSETRELTPTESLEELTDAV